jgi:crotonobetainyl-CoA:carnitine CoA-transferase CaiB-like acyl-CoA transferase
MVPHSIASAGRAEGLDVSKSDVEGKSGPLAGLRVVDFGHFIAGPLAAVMLADQGAEVVHIDAPRRGHLDAARDAFFNRAKRRVTLDLKDAADLAAAWRLVESADVVIENFRPGVLDRLGIAPTAMRAANPSLITCSLPGFSGADARAGLRAFEGVLAAASANCIPRAGEEPEGWDWTRPFHSALPLASSFGGYLGATSIVMALIARRRTGRGQHVEVPLFDAMFTLIGHSGAYVEARGPHAPAGIHGRGAGAYRCGDGRYVQFDTSSPRHLTWFAREAGVLGVFEEELLDLAANTAPEVNRRLHERLGELFATRSAREWEDIGNRAGAAIGFVRTPAEWIETEHARATRAVARVEDPELGPIWCAGLPVSLSRTPAGPVRARELPGRGREAIRPLLDDAPRRPAVAGAEVAIPAPLAGMRVLDLGLALAGPTCGRLLGEFGADVVKIAAPNSGVGGYLNRGKSSLLLDLAGLAGQDVFWRLLRSADVVVENFAPGAAERLGVSYEEVHARLPKVVYTSISCYGRSGPWTARRGWERQGQAVTGIMERTELPSVLGPYNIVDIGTGILGTFATALALYERQESGQGQLASASLAQSATYHQAAFMFDHDGFVRGEPRGYDALGEGPLSRYYRARDRWFFLACREEDRAALADALGLAELATLEGAALEKALEEACGCEDAAPLIARLVAAGVAAQAVISVEELMVDASVRAQGLSITEEVEGVGPCVMPGVSPHLSETPARPGVAPRRPGSDALAVLDSVGLADRLPALERSWAVRTADLPPAWS